MLALRYLREEGLVVHASAFYRTGFTLCAAVSDYVNAEAWAKKAYELTCTAYGERRAETWKVLAQDPRVYEEAGVQVGRVIIHSTQPWPYPANLMIGAIGQAIPGDGEKIDLGNDPELDDAKWFTFDEVRHSLRVGTSGLGEDAGARAGAGHGGLEPGAGVTSPMKDVVVVGAGLAGLAATAS